MGDCGYEHDLNVSGYGYLHERCEAQGMGWYVMLQSIITGIRFVGLLYLRYISSKRFYEVILTRPNKDDCGVFMQCDDISEQI